MKVKKLDFVLLVVGAIAFSAIIGSLYYSTYGDIAQNIISGRLFESGAGLLPCELCWFARIFFYPILPIALIGYIKSDKNALDYILALSLPGMMLEAYHYLLQKGVIVSSSGCRVGIPCNEIQVEYFGFATIPFLAFLGFLAIVMIIIFVKYQMKEEKLSKGDSK